MSTVVKVRYALNFVLACKNIGFNPKNILQSVEIDERVLFDPEKMISERQLWSLVGQLETATGKRDIGLDAGRISHVSEHGALSAIFEEKSLFERLIVFCDLATQEYSKADFFVRPTWNGIVFGRKAIIGELEQIRQVELYVLELLFETIRSILGPSWHPKVLNLQSSHAPELETIASPSEQILRFGQPETEIFLDNSEITFGAKALPRFSAGQKDNVTDAVLSLIRTYLFDLRLSLTFIARLLHINERQLQRDLQKEGSNFTHILRREKIHCAIELLSDPGNTIGEISNCLGYSNQAHFTRAFLTSMGTTPSQFRKSISDGLVKQNRLECRYS